MRNCAAVSWHDSSGEHIRVYYARNGEIVEYIYENGWRLGPFTANGTSVTAIAVRTTSGHVHHHVFTTTDGRTVEHIWENDRCVRGTLDVAGSGAEATAFISDSDQLIMRIYVRGRGSDEEGFERDRVTEWRWDGGPRWSEGMFDVVRWVEGMAAVSWLDRSAEPKPVLRLYQSNGSHMDEYAWNDPASMR